MQLYFAHGTGAEHKAKWTTNACSLVFLLDVSCRNPHSYPWAWLGPSPNSRNNPGFEIRVGGKERSPFPESADEAD